MRFFVILPIFEQNCPKNGVFFGLILDNFLVSFVHRLWRSYLCSKFLRALMKIEPIDFLEFKTNRGALIAAFKPSSKDIWKEDSATEREAGRVPDHEGPGTRLQGHRQPDAVRYP